MSRHGFINTVLILTLFVFVIIAGSCTKDSSPTQAVEPTVDWYAYYSPVTIPEKNQSAIVGFSSKEAAPRDSLIFPVSITIGDFQFFDKGQKVVLNYWDIDVGWFQSVQVRDVVTGDTLALQPSNFLAIGIAGMVVAPDDKHLIVYNRSKGYDYYGLPTLVSLWEDSVENPSDVAFQNNETLIFIKPGSRELHLFDMRDATIGREPNYNSVLTDLLPVAISVDHIRQLFYMIGASPLGGSAFLDKRNLADFSLLDRLQLPDYTGMTGPTINPSNGNVYVSFSCLSNLESQVIEVDAINMTFSVLISGAELVKNGFSPTKSEVTPDGEKIFVLSEFTCYGEFPTPTGSNLVIVDIESRSVDSVFYGNTGGGSHRVHVRQTPFIIE